VDEYYATLCERIRESAIAVLGLSRPVAGPKQPIRTCSRRELNKRNARRELQDLHSLQMKGVIRNPFNSPKFKYDMDRIGRSMGTTQSKRAWDLITKYTNPRTQGVIPPAAALEYFSSVFDSQSLPPLPEESDPIPSIPFSQAEVLMTLKSLPKYKSAGPDGIPADVLICSAEIVAPQYTTLLNKVRNAGYIPTPMSNSFIIPIFKRGNASEIANYRPISIITVATKLLSQLIKFRLLSEFEMQTGHLQAGFRPSRDCADHLQVCETLLPDHDLLFLDLSHAFDSVDRATLCNRIVQVFGHTDLTRILSASYVDQTATLVLVARKQAQSALDAVSGKGIPSLLFCSTCTSSPH